MADMPIRLYRLEVSKGAKLVLSYLWRYAGRERFVWVARETIASDLGIESERTLRRHLGELRKAGAVEEDVQMRAGRARSGWWLTEGGDVRGGADVGRDVGGVSAEHVQPEPPDHHDAADLSDESPDPARPVEFEPAVGGEAANSGEGAEVASVGGQNWPPADKTDRGRTKLAADPAKNGRPLPIELPRTKSLCEPTTAFEPTSDAGGGDSAEGRVRAGLDRLRRWRVHGRDPDGLGAWPTPTTPNGLQLPRLPLGGKLEELLRQDRTPEELHRAVHLVAELVEAGAIPASKWRATYVFSGWLEELVVTALERRAKQAWRERQRATALGVGALGQPSMGREPSRDASVGREPSRDASVGRELSRDGMLQALESSITLRPIAPAPRASSPKRSRSPPAPDNYRELLDLRSQVEAMAEQLGRPPKDLLKALGRASMRELEVGDRTRLGEVFSKFREISESPATAETATGPPLEVGP